MHILPPDENLNLALQVRNITAGYGGVPIVKDVSVSVAGGRITTIIGPNGAGKSTLLKAITGIVPCMGGTVFLDGEAVGSLRTDQLAKRGLAYVPQVQDVFDPLSVRDNLEMGAYLVPKAEVAIRMEEVFETFPALTALTKRRAGNLSGGERKMLAIGRVIMTHPKVLLLDEPTAGLAPQLARNLLEEHVTKLAGLGVAILLVEQRVADALAVSDTAYVMVAGEVKASGSARELAARGDIGTIFLSPAAQL